MRTEIWVDQQNRQSVLEVNDVGIVMLSIELVRQMLTELGHTPAAAPDVSAGPVHPLAIADDGQTLDERRVQRVRAALAARDRFSDQPHLQEDFEAILADRVALRWDCRISRDAAHAAGQPS